MKIRPFLWLMPGFDVPIRKEKRKKVVPPLDRLPLAGVLKATMNSELVK